MRDGGNEGTKDMKLEVGKTYKLNNGEVHKCERMWDEDPLSVDEYGYGPFVIHGMCYHMNGVFAGGKSEDYNVASCVDDTPTLWRDMTQEEKGALLLAHHEGKVIEFWANSIDKWVDHHPTWSDRLSYRIKPEPKVETSEGTCWAYHYRCTEPSLAGHNANGNCTEGNWTATRVDGKLTKITWEVL